jgi:hypothetical protein
MKAMQKRRRREQTENKTNNAQRSPVVKQAGMLGVVKIALARAKAFEWSD